MKIPDDFDLHDLSYASLRSALIIDPADPKPPLDWDLFNYGRGCQVPGTSRVMPATKIHTNLPRPGDSGLPKDWEMKVYRWRATLSEPFEQPILDWAADTSVEFKYNQRPVANAKLSDLLLSPEVFPVPVHMLEGLSYGVHVETQHNFTLGGLNHHIRMKPPAGRVLTVWVHLDGPIVRPVV